MLSVALPRRTSSQLNEKMSRRRTFAHSWTIRRGGIPAAMKAPFRAPIEAATTRSTLMPSSRSAR